MKLEEHAYSGNCTKGRQENMHNTDAALYRGLDYNGNWRYGALFCGEDDTGSKRKVSYIIGDVCDPDGGYFGAEKVLGESVGKFTGLYDYTTWDELSNEEQEAFFREQCCDASDRAKEVFLPLCCHLWKGRKIFTGDVVKHFNKEFDEKSYDTGVVMWDCDNLRLIRTSREHKGKCFPLSKACIYKVIGNLRDTPGLFSSAVDWANPPEPEV